MEDLYKVPRWAWELTIATLAQEEVHPKLYTFLSDGTYQESAWCPSKVLEIIPEEIRTAAEGMLIYQRQGLGS